MSVFTSKRTVATTVVAAAASVALAAGTAIPASAADNQLTIGADLIVNDDRVDVRDRDVHGRSGRAPLTITDGVRERICPWRA